MNIIEITSEEARRMVKDEDTILVDVRTPTEFELYRVEEGNVVNIPLDELKENHPDLKKYRRILCICRTNRRSTEAARILGLLGFDRVYVVKDGVVGWLNMIDKNQ